MLLGTGKKWTEIFSPSGNLKAGPGPRDSHQLLVKRTQKEVMTPEKGLHCKGAWPEPKDNVSASKASPTASKAQTSGTLACTIKNSVYLQWGMGGWAET